MAFGVRLVAKGRREPFDEVAQSRDQTVEVTREVTERAPIRRLLAHEVLERSSEWLERGAVLVTASGQHERRCTVDGAIGAHAPGELLSEPRLAGTRFTRQQRDGEATGCADIPL